LKAALKRLLGLTSPKTHGPALDQLTDVRAEDQEILAKVRRHTMTSNPRIITLLETVDYLVRAGIEGAFAECGVWRGGSAMAMVLKLQSMGVNDRDIYLYDTFEGMTQPSERDTSVFDRPALETWKKYEAAAMKPWDFYFNSEIFNETDVRKFLLSSGYPPGRIHLVKGKVEDTIPGQAPQQLALLRLDTDWYESTRHEMQHLYPRIAIGGALIIDDYGHWQGSRQAVDEYMSGAGVAPVLLNRIDYAARLAIKR
jgi:hypothetical protein